MIDKNNLQSLFTEIDEHLLGQGENSNRVLTIYGGAALISLGVSERATVDIDVFDPKLDEALERSIKSIAKKYFYDERWVNSTGSAFSYELPDGWRERSQIIFKGKLLTVKVLGRVDLIFTKFLAELDRGEDLEDLINLKPSHQELQSIERELKGLELEPTWSKKVDEIIKVLLREKI